ncbi:MAG: hypothetical protein WDA42_00015 [Candidatus Bathyarchaeia archaeon]|jgi:hypothetical protein
MTVINKFYTHIDNGGITVTVSQEDIHPKLVSIEFDTSYFGYDAISAKLNLYTVDAPKFLKELGVMLIAAADKVVISEE